MPHMHHHAYWNNNGGLIIPIGPGVTPIRYTSEFLVITYYFNSGRDLDTRTKLADPDLGDYLGWARASDVGNGLLVWGGDNTGTGLESVAVDIYKFKTLYPNKNTITLNFRCFWYGTVGTTPVQLNLTLYKGGQLTRAGFGFTNTTAADSKQVTSFSKTISLFTRTASNNGQGLATMVYNVYSGTGYLNTNYG